MIKYLCSLTIFLSFNNFSIAQKSDKLFDKEWGIGLYKNFNGNNILRLAGDNNSKGITNIDFKTLEQIKEEIVKKSESEMWTLDKKKTELDFYNKNVFISIDLYITRRTIGSANFKFYSIIVNDSNENEIYRTDFEEAIPNVPLSGSDYWWNFTQINLPKEIKGKNFIYIIDQIQSKRFKFEINIK